MGTPYLRTQKTQFYRLFTHLLGFLNGLFGYLVRMYDGFYSVANFQFQFHFYFRLSFTLDA